MIDIKFSSVIHSMKQKGSFDFSSLIYGWHKKSLGIKLLKDTNKNEWIRISEHVEKQEAEIHSKRILDSNEFTGINKPEVYHASVMEMDGKFWSIITMSYHTAKSLSSTPDLKNYETIVSMKLLLSIQNQLKNLARQASPYVAYRQEFITRRILERYQSGINTIISDWNVVHADLHWANISADGFIFDWEGYGIGPKGIDLVFLYLFSLMNKETKELIENVFSDYFLTHDFKICLLFGISELMRMTEKYNDYPELYPHLEMLGIKTHKELL